MKSLSLPVASCALRRLLPVVGCLGLLSTAGAQPPDAPTGPALSHTAVRSAPPAPLALVGATVWVRPDRKIEGATLLLRGGRVDGVGTNLRVPADAVTLDLSGKVIYPGFLDPMTEYGLETPPPDRAAPGRSSGPPGPGGGRARNSFSLERGALSWNEAIRADRRAAESFQPDEDSARKLLARGVTAVATVRRDGIFRGRAAVVSTAPTGRPAELLLRAEGPHHASFDRGTSRQIYPSSLMGAMALVRQTLLDARWVDSARRASLVSSAPEVDLSLLELARAFPSTGPAEALWFETRNEQDLLRAARLGAEARVPLVLVGSGFEWRRLEEVLRQRSPIVLPVRLPERPDVGTASTELDVSLTDLRHFERAPHNAKWLVEGGLDVAWTGTGLREREDFWTALRRFVESGLPAEKALAGLTTTPARLLGLDRELGTLEPGRRADLVIASGDLFEKGSRILEVWIGGAPVHTVEPHNQLDARGRYRFDLAGKALELSLEGSSPLDLKGTIMEADRGGSAPEADGTSSGKEGGTVSEKEGGTFPASSGKEGGTSPAQSRLESIRVERFEVSFRADLASVGGPAGTSRFRIVERRGRRLLEHRPPGEEHAQLLSLEPLAAGPSKVAASRTDERRALRSRRTFPDAPYGFDQLPQQETVVVRSATLWTSGPRGRLEAADLFVRDGKIVAVGPNLSVPAGVREIDGRGLHVTPGLIDEHSHLAISGGVNEASHAVTSEVRIADVIDPDDIGIFRALAGGTTAAQLLHGSANPIGGQAAIIKHRWGAPAPEMLVPDARPTIKFALGENVKQSNWTDPTDRYPKTRMGVDTRIRDAFLAAREYRERWERHQKLSPAERARAVAPRRDLTLEALAEILEGKRDIHCHSYVQSEILALMRLAEELGFRIHTFTHILEGYKVAPEMARHGAMASSFADWWAYKFEVYDAIPQNTCLMHDAGVVVSVNSDSEELIRRLNQEASKSVLHCGMSEEDALKMVTLNAARQLGIDHRTGSLEPGKDADFVLWNGHPLSTLSRPLETWIDGRRYFSIEQAERQLALDREERRALIDDLLARPEDRGGRGPGSRESHPNERYDCEDTRGFVPLATGESEPREASAAAQQPQDARVSGTPSFLSTNASGQRLVQPDWKRFAPTKAVNASHHRLEKSGLPSTPKSSEIKMKAPAKTRM